MGLRWLGAVVLVALALGGAFVGQAVTAGPGGWDHLGDAGTPGSDSLNGNVNVINGDAPNVLLVGGEFTDAGGNPAADKLASWNGSAWSAVGNASDQLNGGVFAIAYANGKTYAGGAFTNAGGDPNADFLAVWNGQAWAPFCNPAVPGPAFGGNVKALQVIGSTLYVGGEFQNGAGIATADYLVACDLTTGAATSTLADSATFGPIAALTADSNGVLYAGGRFAIAGIPEADNVAYLDANGWHAMGTGGGACQCAIDGFVRSLTAVGTDVYVGTDVKDVAGIAQADNVAHWNGSAWSAVGSDATGTNGWFPASTFIYALTTFGSKLFAAGSFQDAAGNPAADNVAYYDGSAWHPVGSDGAGNGPLNAQGNALAIFDRLAAATVPRSLFAGGSFTSAGGDPQARGVASFSLAAITPVATPTVTPGAVPTPVPTPVATPNADAPGDPDAHAEPRHDPAEDHRATPVADDLPRRAVRRPLPRGARSDRHDRDLRAVGAGQGAVHDRPVGVRSLGEGPVRQAVEHQPRRPRCTRWLAVKGSFTVTGKKGVNRIELRGRIGGRTLLPGRYRLNARETDRAANRSATKRTAFRIVR